MSRKLSIIGGLLHFSVFSPTLLQHVVLTPSLSAYTCTSSFTLKHQYDSTSGAPIQVIQFDVTGGILPAALTKYITLTKTQVAAVTSVYQTSTGNFFLGYVPCSSCGRRAYHFKKWYASQHSNIGFSSRSFLTVGQDQVPLK